VNFSETNTVVVPKLHVSALSGTGSRSGLSTNYTVDNVTITVLDQNNAPVLRVVVSGSWSAGGPAANGCTTDARGTCNIDNSRNRITTSPVTWTVSGLALSGYTYDSAANLKNSIQCTRSTSSGGATTCIAS
jgi:hypothetical protein